MLTSGNPGKNTRSSDCSQGEVTLEVTLPGSMTLKVIDLEGPDYRGPSKIMGQTSETCDAESADILTFVSKNLLDIKLIGCYQVAKLSFNFVDL